jgi:hypothetical protein
MYIIKNLGDVEMVQSTERTDKVWVAVKTLNKDMAD